MLARRLFFAVLALIVLAVAGGGTSMRLWDPIPSPRPFKPYSEEVWNVMQAARKASRADDHQQAIELYTRALAIEPGPNLISQELHALRGSEYNYLNAADKAFADFDVAIRFGYTAPLSDAAIRAHMGRGYASMQTEHYARAKDDFDIVLGALSNDVPRSSSALAWRGTAHHGLRDRGLQSSARTRSRQCPRARQSCGARKAVGRRAPRENYFACKRLKIHANFPKSACQIRRLHASIRGKTATINYKKRA